MRKINISILALRNANYASMVDARAVFESANLLCKEKFHKELLQSRSLERHLRSLLNRV